MHIYGSIYSVVMGMAVVMKCVMGTLNQQTDFTAALYHSNVLCHLPKLNVRIMHKCIGTFWSMSAAQLTQTFQNQKKCF
jgi:hypothetical protein